MLRNFLTNYLNTKTMEMVQLSASQFMEIWENYDKDGNGYIEGKELDNFLKELVTCALPYNSCVQVTGKDLAELRTSFLEAYDHNKDGKIEIKELAYLLPVDENFLMLFRYENPLESSVEFMKLWYTYDTDRSGFIEADELKNFLRDLLKEARKSTEITEDQLIEYTDSMLQIFDSNRDGKLQLSEMAKLLPVQENFLTRSMFKGSSVLTREDVENVFSLYDRDCSGSIERDELSGFLKDLLELIKKDYDTSDMDEFEETIMKGCDTNRDGKISKKELTMILIALSQQ